MAIGLSIWGRQLYDGDVEGGRADFDLSMYSDVPLYNIQAVAASTGVPAITLRSWERRYGVPQPKRDAKGYRLYSDRDVALTRWLRERVQQGVGISRAVNLLRALETGALAPEPGPRMDFAALRSHLIEATARIDEAAMARVIAEALVVGTVEEVCLDVLQPALYEIGERWAAGRLSVTCEHVGSNLIRAHLVQLLRLTPPPIREDMVLVGCAPSELHDLGALMLTLFLRRRGFGVLYAGANVEPDSFMADACALHPAAVCISASTRASATSLASLCERMKKAYRGILGVGGRAFQEIDELAERMPGTYLGTNAAHATQALEALLASEESGRSPRAVFRPAQRGSRSHGTAGRWS